VKNPRESAAYTFGYNPTVFARRVHDILGLVKLARSREPRPDAVCLVGLDGAGPLVAAACAQAAGAVDRAVIDTGGFRFGKVRDLHSPDFLPGGAKYFDLPGMIALGAPTRLLLAGEGDQAPEIVATAYEAAQAKNRLTVFGGDATKTREAAVKWLLEPPAN
jgi:hypothetical protein